MPQQLAPSCRVEPGRIEQLFAPVVALRKVGVGPIARHGGRLFKTGVKRQVVEHFIDEDDAVARVHLRGQHGCHCLGRGRRLELQSRHGGWAGEQKHQAQASGTGEHQRPFPSSRGKRHGHAQYRAPRCQGGQRVAHQLRTRQAEEADHRHQPPRPQTPTRAITRAVAIPISFQLHQRRWQPGAPRQAEQRQHSSIKPHRMHIVEAGLRKAAKVLLHDEVVKKARVAHLHQGKPRQGQCRKKQQSERVQQPQQVTPPTLRQQPGRDHQGRQHKADQTLGQHRGGGQGPGRKHPAPTARAVVHRTREGQHRGRDQAAHQHVEVGILTADEEEGAGGQHQHRGPRRRRAVPAPHRHEQRRAHHPSADKRRKASAELVHADRRHGQHVQPVQQRRLVKKRQAVEERHQTVAAVAPQHVARHVGVAAFVGQQQGAQAHGGHQPQGQEQQDGSGASPGGLRRRFSGHDGDYSIAVARISPPSHPSSSPPAPTSWFLPRCRPRIRPVACRWVSRLATANALSAQARSWLWRSPSEGG